MRTDTPRVHPHARVRRPDRPSPRRARRGDIVRARTRPPRARASRRFARARVRLDEHRQGTIRGISRSSLGAVSTRRRRRRPGRRAIRRARGESASETRRVESRARGASRRTRATVCGGGRVRGVSNSVGESGGEDAGMNDEVVLCCVCVCVVPRRVASSMSRVRFRRRVRRRRRGHPRDGRRT